MELKDNIYCHAIPCAVCGKPISLTPTEAIHTTFRLCDECLQAIRFAKQLMKNNPNMEIPK